MPQLKYQRILLKLSGEALMGDSQEMFNKDTLDGIMLQIKQLIELNVKLGIVIGGGNIFRGVRAQEFGLQRANADYMGILATIMNGIALKDFLTTHNIQSRIYSAIPIGNLIEGYNRDRMLARMAEGNVIIFVAGTGNPFFTTDSGAALRAIEMDADLLIKATKVNGVYDSDPLKNVAAKRYKSLSFDDAIDQNLKIMDMAAFDLCRANNVNIAVCSVFSPNSLKDAAEGNNQGTLIYV
jgi:uridylate kinase